MQGHARQHWQGVVLLERHHLKGIVRCPGAEQNLYPEALWTVDWHPAHCALTCGAQQSSPRASPTGTATYQSGPQRTRVDRNVPEWTRPQINSEIQDLFRFPTSRFAWAASEMVPLVWEGKRSEPPRRSALLVLKHAQDDVRHVVQLGGVVQPLGGRLAHNALLPQRLPWRRIQRDCSTHCQIEALPTTCGSVPAMLPGLDQSVWLSMRCCTLAACWAR